MNSQQDPKPPARPGRPLQGLLLRLKALLAVLIPSPRIMVGSSIVLVFILLAILAPLIAPYDPLKINLRNKYKPPSAAHWLGTDVHGRDILSRLIWGTRISLQTALGSVAIGMVIGILIGVSAGYFGGRVDSILGRILDIMLAFPSFVLSLVIIAALGRGLFNMILAIGFSITPQLARLVRAVALYVKENQFVEASKSFAISEWRIILRHILPHSLTPIVVYCTLSLGTAVLIEAALSFLGLGIPPPTPSWGKMVDEGRYVLRFLPWFSTAAGGFIMLLVMGFNLLGDGLRDHLDPRLRGGVQ